MPRRSHGTFIAPCRRNRVTVHAVARWRAADVVVERFGTSEVLVARTGGTQGQLISLDDARVLVACEGFDDDDAHAARIAEDVELAAPEIVAALDRLRGHGLLVSDEEA